MKRLANLEGSSAAITSSFASGVVFSRARALVPDFPARTARSDRRCRAFHHRTDRLCRGVPPILASPAIAGDVAEFYRLAAAWLGELPLPPAALPVFCRVLSSPLAFPFVLGAGAPLGLDNRGLALLPGAVAPCRGAMEASRVFEMIEHICRS
jgi:hypothetical protein